MKDYLEHYEGKIYALSPIYVGSGEKIKKNAYIYAPRNHRVVIPDIEKMYTALRKKGLEREFTSYLMSSGDRGPSLAQWLGSHGISEKEWREWKRYEMDAGEAFLQLGPRKKSSDIDGFCRDGYGMPYVPGSSIKGMLRTALLASEIENNPEKYKRIALEISEKSQERAKRIPDRACLMKETQKLEQQAFYTLGREQRLNSAVNDHMAGLLVGDSEPIDLEQLTLSQKIDVTLNGEEKPLPILRETLKPGTEIRFSLTIDRTLCPYSIEKIESALDQFQKTCYDNFYMRFHRGTKEKGIVWLGGGCGFPTKTVLYPMFGRKAVRVIDQINRNTLHPKVYAQHKHAKDVGLGVAPHVCKCTKYQGELYDMGMGRIEFSRQ